LARRLFASQVFEKAGAAIRAVLEPLCHWPAMRLHEGEVPGKKLDHATTQWLRANRYYALWRHTVAQLQPKPKTFQILN